MADILPFYIIAINSILIAKYYSDFFTPRSIVIPKRFVLITFGSSYLLSQYAIKQFFTGFPFHIAAFSNIFILIVITITLSHLFFKDGLGKQVFFLFSFFAVQEVCLFISFSIFGLSGNAIMPIINFLMHYIYVSIDSVYSFLNIFTTLQYATQMLVYTSVGFFALQNIKKSFVYKNFPTSLSELSYLILPCLSVLSVTFIIRAIVFKPEGDGAVMLFNDVPFASFLIPLAGFILLLGLIASIKLFQRLAESHNEEREKAILQTQIQQLQEQIRDADSIYTEIKGIRHDMKSHISNIRLLVTAVMEGNHNVKEELEEYLGKFETALCKFDFAFQTGNSISDIIIHQKYTEAINNEINFTSDFSYPTLLKLDVYDLAIILNNAIENAIEACNDVEPPYRFIHLYSYTKGEMFFIEVENSFVGSLTINEQTSLPISRKSSTDTHGMGISNIQRCARKYFGDIDFQVKATKNYNVFRLTVMLQGRK